MLSASVAGQVMEAGQGLVHLEPDYFLRGWRCGLPYYSGGSPGHGVIDKLVAVLFFPSEGYEEVPGANLSRVHGDPVESAFRSARKCPQPIPKPFPNILTGEHQFFFAVSLALVGGSLK